jgi:hypothetical protein
MYKQEQQRIFAARNSANTAASATTDDTDADTDTSSDIKSSDSSDSSSVDDDAAQGLLPMRAGPTGSEVYTISLQLIVCTL